MTYLHGGGSVSLQCTQRTGAKAAHRLISGTGPVSVAPSRKVWVGGVEGSSRPIVVVWMDTNMTIFDVSKRGGHFKRTPTSFPPSQRPGTSARSWDPISGWYGGVGERGGRAHRSATKSHARRS